MKYFTLKELCASSKAASLNIDNIPDKDAESRLVDLVDLVLDPIREKIGEPITVSSGYRSRKLNRAVKGAATSQHLTGEAVDILAKRHEGESQKQANRRLFNLIASMINDGSIIVGQLIDEFDYSWIHVSIPRRSGNVKINQILHLGSK